MELGKLALIALLASLLFSSAVSNSTPESGSGEEGFVITKVDSKPKGKAIKLKSDNNGTLTPLENQEVQKWRIACPETAQDENLKLVFLLLHANLEPGDFLQFNKVRYEGSKSSPTVIDFDKSRDSFLVSHVTEEGNSDFDLRYVCPYSNFHNCKDLHECPAVVDYVAETTEAYNSLASLCYNPRAIRDDGKDRYLCQLVRLASDCDLNLPLPLLSCQEED